MRIDASALPNQFAPLDMTGVQCIAEPTILHPQKGSFPIDIFIPLSEDE